jgi:glycosyltransferase involved in cell wall biosynthesis
MGNYFFINQYASTPKEGFGGRYYYLAKSLAESGHEVLLVTSANHHLLRSMPNFKGLWKKENYKGLDILWLKTLPYTRANSPIRVLNWFIFAFYIPFLFLLNLKPSQIHYSSPSPIGFIGAWALAKLTRAKTVFDVRDVWPETFVQIGGIARNNLFVRFLSYIEIFCYRKANVVSSNLANLDIRLQETGVTKKKFLWIPNGISIPDVEDSIKTSVIQLPESVLNKKIIGYTGTVGEANALGTMLESAKCLKDDNRYAFLIVGKGKELSDLVAYCDTNGMSNVIFMDTVPKHDIYKLQSLMDVLCVGAKTSSLYKYGVSPNKLYEYIYSGVPVIYYIDTPSYHPVIDAACGVEIPSSNVTAFVKAIHDLTSLPPLSLESIRESSKNYIIENHTYDKLAVRLVNEVKNYA